MNNRSDIEITICSDLDYECLIAEIVINGKFIGLITNEPNRGIYFEVPDKQVSTINIALDVLESALKQAKSELLMAQQ